MRVRLVEDQGQWLADDVQRYEVHDTVQLAFMVPAGGAPGASSQFGERSPEGEVTQRAFAPAAVTSQLGERGLEAEVSPVVTARGDRRRTRGLAFSVRYGPYNEPELQGPARDKVGVGIKELLDKLAESFEPGSQKQNDVLDNDSEIIAFFHSIGVDAKEIPKTPGYKRWKDCLDKTKEWLDKVLRKAKSEFDKQARADKREVDKLEPDEKKREKQKDDIDRDVEYKKDQADEAHKRATKKMPR